MNRNSFRLARKLAVVAAPVAVALTGGMVMLTAGAASAADEYHLTPQVTDQPEVDVRTETSLTVNLSGIVYDVGEATFELSGDLSMSIEADCTYLYSGGNAYICHADGVVLDGLTPDRNYDIEVSTIDAFGIRSPARDWSFQIDSDDDFTPPSVPTNVVYTPRDESDPLYYRFGSLGVLSWDVSTDNVSPAEDIQYNVYVNGMSQPAFFFVPPWWGWHSVDFGVEAECGGYLALPAPGTEYRVTAVDRAGNESALSEPFIVQ